MLLIDDVTQYALDVLEGVEVAGPYVRAAARRHLADRNRTDIYFDHAEYDRVVNRFFQGRLKLSEGQFEGEPFKLHASQKFILGSIFGWKRPDGTRRFRRAYIEEGKGNGKSPMVGGIGLFGMMYDNEPGAQIYSAGATREQSDILFQDAVKMAKAAPRIDADVTYSGNTKIWNMAALGHRQKGAFFRPLARTAGKSGSGVRPHFALCDELHEHPSSDVIDLLERGFKFRRNPLLVMITNSGSDRKSVCWHEREHAVSVVTGEAVDDSTFAYVCALDDGDDPLEDPTCWKKANPLLGVTITEDYLAGVVAQARSMPTKRNGVLRLHFCVWTDAETVWIPREAWEACEDPDMTLDDFVGQPCRAGLDLSSRKDLSATALCFDDGFVFDQEQEIVKPKYALFVHCYTPEKTLDARARDDRAPYRVWVDQGFLTATEGPVIRFEFIAKDLSDYANRFEMQVVAFDRYLINKFEETLSEMGIELPLMEHPQGFNQRKDTKLWMPKSIETFEELILERRIRIQVNPVLRSAAAGATFVKSPADLKRFAKDKATQRIDPVVAAAMAVGASTIAEEGEGLSVYEALARERLARQQTVQDKVKSNRYVSPNSDLDDDEEL